MLIGADRFTGKKITGPERAVQNIETTLTVALRDQPGNRAFGTKLPFVISEPATEDHFFTIFEAVAIACEYEVEAELLNFGFDSINANGAVRAWYRIRFIPDGTIYRRFINEPLEQEQ